MTESALLEALLAAQTVPDQTGLTVQEIRERTHLGETKIRRLIRAGVEAGTVRVVWRTMRQVHGVVRRVPAYEAVPP